MEREELLLNLKNMNIRKATIQDLQEILNIYARARSFMVTHGNPRQWAANGWPPEELIRKDISDGKLYLCIDQDVTGAVFFMILDRELSRIMRRLMAHG